MLAEALFSNRRRLIALSVFLVVGFGLGIPKLSITPDTRVFFSKDDHHFLSLVEFEKTFLPTHNIMFGISSEQTLLESERFRDSIRWLSMEVATLSNIQRVDSLATLSHTYSNAEDQIQIESYLSYLCSGKSCNKSRGEVLKQPILVNRLIDEDMHTAAVVGIFKLDLNDSAKISEISAQALDLRHQFKERYPSLDTFVTGGIPMAQEFMHAGQRDSMELFALSGISIVVLLFFALGTIRNTAIMMLTAACSVVVAMGSGGWMGIVLNTASATVPIIVFTLVVASSMHMFLHFLRLCEDSRGTAFAAMSAVNANWLPTLLTAFTSGVSLLSLTFVESPPVQDIGLLAAIGTLAGAFFCIGLAPQLLDTERTMKNSAVNEWLQILLNRYSLFLKKHRSSVAIGAFVVMLGSASGLSHLYIDDDFVNYFSDNTQFKKDTKKAIQELSGPNHIEVVISSRTDDGVFDPEVIEIIRRLTEHVRNSEIVSNAVSLVDILDTIISVMEPEGSIDNMPASALAQFFLAYEMSLRPGASSSSILTSDHTATHLSVLLGQSTASSIRELEASIYEFADQADPEGLTEIQVTGENIPVAHLSSSNIPAVLKTLGTSLLFTALLLGMYFRNWRISVNALIAMTVPIAAGFGMWGWVSDSIGLAATIVVAVALGVVIDDAIHLLYRQQDARRHLSQGPWESAAYSIHRVGVPIVSTTLVFVIGLLPLTLSDFEVNRTFAMCTCLILSASLLFDLAILPGLMKWAADED